MIFVFLFLFLYFSPRSVWFLVWFNVLLLFWIWRMKGFWFGFMCYYCSRFEEEEILPSLHHWEKKNGNPNPPFITTRDSYGWVLPEQQLSDTLLDLKKKKNEGHDWVMITMITKLTRSIVESSITNFISLTPKTESSFYPMIPCVIYSFVTLHIFMVLIFFNQHKRSGPTFMGRKVCHWSCALRCDCYNC